MLCQVATPSECVRINDNHVTPSPQALKKMAAIAAQSRTSPIFGARFKHLKYGFFLKT
jgi:hypothetical protein